MFSHFTCILFNPTGLIKLSLTKTKLLAMLKSPSNTTTQSPTEDCATALTNVLCSQTYYDTLQEFQYCRQILEKNVEDCEVVPKSDVIAMKKILNCILENGVEDAHSKIFSFFFGFSERKFEIFSFSV